MKIKAKGYYDNDYGGTYYEWVDVCCENGYDLTDLFSEFLDINVNSKDDTDLLITAENGKITIEKL